MRIILTGSKASGKTTIGRELGKRLELEVVETDTITEDLFAARHGKAYNCRQICAHRGEPFFRDLEHDAVFEALKHEACIICTGGQTMMDARCREALVKAGWVVLLQVRFEAIWERIERDGYPSYFPEANRKAWFADRVAQFRRRVLPVADSVCDVNDLSPAEATNRVMSVIENEVQIS